MAAEVNSEENLLDSSPSNLCVQAKTNEHETEHQIILDDSLLLSSPSQSPKAHISPSNTDRHKSLSDSSSKSDSAQVISDDDDVVILEDKSITLNSKLDIKRRSSILNLDDCSDTDEDDIDDEEEEDISSSEESFTDESESMSSEQSDSFMDKKIKIFYTHGAFFLWNAEDVQMLREECRIVGKLTGCLPRAPRQNNYLGLPLQLMPEEAKLLVDIDAAVVVEEDAANEKLLNTRERAFKEVREENFVIQQRLYNESRQEEVRHRFKDIIAGKKAKKRKLNGSCNLEGVSEVKGQDPGEQSQAEGNIDATDSLTAEDIVQSEVSAKHALVQIFTETPWNQSVHQYEDWEFPYNSKELIRYLVFKDLWSKGFFMTSGSKFGGDFLIYPGDPARYHSHYIAVCRNHYDEIPSLELISLGRLATSVRKTALLCSVDHKRKVFYTSLKWTGVT